MWSQDDHLPFGCVWFFKRSLKLWKNVQNLLGIDDQYQSPLLGWRLSHNSCSVHYFNFHSLTAFMGLENVPKSILFYEEVQETWAL